MMKLDPSEEDSDDSGNGGRESPVGEGGQMTDLEVYHEEAFVFLLCLFFIQVMLIYKLKSICVTLVDSLQRKY